jgi:CRISPR/Cas system-associated exonuclease Cas4 (RecB family)
LSARLLADIRGVQAGRPLAPVVVLVRSNLVALQLSRRLAREAGGYANVRFLTFVDLAQRLAGPGRVLPAGGERVIFAALAARTEAASYFGPVKDRPGLAETLRAAAEDIRQAGLGSWHVDLNVGEKLTLFGKIYDEYRTLLGRDGRRYRDEFDVFSGAAERAATFADSFGTAELFAFGFYDFNEIQRRLLLALSERVRLEFYMPFDEGPQFRFARPTVRWLEAMGTRVEAVPAADVGARDEVRRVWFDRRGEAARAEGVRIISAPDEEGEAREVAREALRLSREYGVRLAEMAVLYRGEEMLAALTEVFERVFARVKGGPYYVAEGRPLAAARAGEGTRRLLELAWHAKAGPRPFARGEVVDFAAAAPLASGEISGPEGGLEAATWDDVSAAAGIVYGREEWGERLERYAAACERATGEGPRRHDAVDVRRLAAFADGLFADLERFPAEGSWADFVDVLAEVVARYFEPSEERDAVLSLVRSVAAYDDVVAEPVPFKVFVETLTERLDEEKMPAGRFERGGVNLVKLDTVRNLAFRAVFITGAAEGVYPTRPPQDPVLLDGERAEFNDRADGRWRFDVRASRVAEEPLIFHLALGAAREFLCISYHRRDAAGRDLLPSYYLLKVAGALAGATFGAEDFDRAASAYPWFRRVGAAAAPAPAEALDDGEYWAGRAREAGEGRVGAYLAAVDARCAAARDAAASARATGLTPFDGLVVSAAGKDFLARRFGGKVVPVGTSDLEALAACPRKFFYERILGLRSWEEPREKLMPSPVALGKAVHDVLRDVYRQFATRGPDDERLEAEVARRTEAALAALGEEGELPRPLAFEMERRLLSRKLAAFVREDVGNAEGWRPTFFELRFGRRRAESDDAESTEKPFLLKFGEGEGGPAAEIHGRIDRVDGRDGGVRILDYKAGRRDRYVGHVAGGRQLQLPLYLMAYCDLFGAEVGSSLAGYCFPLEDGEKYKYVVSERKGLDAAAVRRLAGGVLALARDGIFVAGGGDVCRYCDFRIACDAGRGYLSERKWASPEASRLRELREIK